MRRLLGFVTAVALVAIVCAATNPTAVAQKDKSTKKGGPGTVEIGEGKDGKFRLTIRDADGKYLAVSAPHATEKEARAAIDELRDALTKAKVVVKKGEPKKDKEKEKKTGKEKSEK